MGTSLAAPSLTPFYALREGVNPSIRVFTLEKDTWTPLDYTQYYADLEEANSMCHRVLIHVVFFVYDVFFLNFFFALFCF